MSAPPLPGERFGRAPNPLADYADEVAALANGLHGARFRGSERYVIDTDALQRALTDLAQRMRRTASEQRPSDRIVCALGLTRATKHPAVRLARHA